MRVITHKKDRANHENTDKSIPFLGLLCKELNSYVFGSITEKRGHIEVPAGPSTFEKHACLCLDYTIKFLSFPL